MIDPLRLLFVVAGSIAIGFLFSDHAGAETWSDKTGKFQIEAEYVGVRGKSVVLRKLDGKTLNVPIDQLSPESREQAKRLYTMAKLGGGAPAPAPAASPAPSLSTAPAAATSQPARKLNFTPPTPPVIPPLPAFPENASLQETVDFVLAQLKAGHPEVFWHALPSEVRSTIDSEEFRTSLRPIINEQAQTGKQMEEVLMKGIEVLVTKKDFLLNSPLIAQVPPPLMESVQQGYDPAVGLIFEIATLSFNSDPLANQTVTDVIDHHGPRIGGHLQELVKMAPPGMIDQFLTQIAVEQTQDSAGTITVPDNEGGTETTEMVKYAGRWLPKDIAEQWEANKEGMASKLAAQMNAAKEQNPEAAQQAKMMVGMFVGMANSVLDPMLAASSQQEFDQAVMQITAMMNMGGGGGGPGGVETSRTFKDGVEVLP